MTGQPRWAHVTYASFRNRAGSGGWHTGPSVEATSEEEALVMEYAPTSVVPTAPIDDFISAGEIAELPRRFEYLPLGDRGLFMQSVPAGKDATGRPGNVFTHAAIDRDLAEPLSATYPVNLYRSPDLQTPFRIAEVEAVELDPQLQEPRPGPLTDLSVAWTMVTTMLGNRSGALFRLQDVLSEGETTPVLVLKSSNEAVYWLQVLSSTLSPAESRRLLRFSTSSGPRRCRRRCRISTTPCSWCPSRTRTSSDAAAGSPSLTPLTRRHSSRCRAPRGRC